MHQPINTIVDHDDVFRAQSSHKRPDTMQPMVSGGKLLEPQLLPNKDQDEVLQPTYERTKDGPRINVIEDSDTGDESVVIPTNVTTTSRRADRTLRADDLAAGDSSPQVSRAPSVGGDGSRRKKLSSGNLETDEHGGDVSL